MKKFTLLILAVFFAAASWAQGLNESFEGAAFPPVGWSAYAQPYQRVSTNAATGTYSIYVASSISRYTYGLVTPQITVTGGDVLLFKMTISGYFYGTSEYSSNMRVKVSTTDNQQASFTTIKEFSTYPYSGIHSNNVILASADLLDVWYEAETDLSAYAGQSIYIALELYDNWGCDNLWIDDVMVEGNSCPKPTISVSAAENSATVTLTENGDAANWQYLISTTSTMPDESEAVDLGSSTFEIESLNPSTQYYIWVRSACDFDEYSNWTAGNFRTECGTIIVGSQWVENFNSYSSGAFPNCWTRTIPYDSYGTIYPRITSDYGISLDFHGSATQMVATPEFAEEVNTLEIEFDLRRESAASSGTFEVGVLSDPNDDDTFVSIQNVTDMITVSDGNYDRYTVSLASAPAGYHYIAFRQITTSNYWYWLDNIDVHPIPDCPRPTIENVSAVENSATVTLFENGSAESWQYLISTTSTMPNESEAVDVSENPFEIEGLNASTQYYIWVRSACGFDEYSLWTAVRGFRTTCGVMSLPFVEGFEDGISDCWANIDADGDGFKWEIGVETSSGTGISAHSGTQSAISASWYDDGSWYGQELTPNNYLVTPKLAIPVEGVAALTYWVAAQDPTYPQDHYSVKISTTDLNPASFIEVFEETLSTSEWQERTVVLSDYSGQDIYIAFVHNECTDWFVMKIDDVEVAIMPNCPRPTITSVSTTETSATVELTENGSAAN